MPGLEGARVASPDGSHCRSSRAEDRLGGNRLPAQSCRRLGVPLSESGRFPDTGCNLRPRHRVVRRERGLDQRPRAGGYGRSAAPARADRGRCCPPATPACSGRCIPGGRSCGRVPGDTRLVVSEPIGDLPGAWNEMPQHATGDREGTAPAAALQPSSRRRPRDRVRAGRLHAAADRPPDVGTSGPDPGPAAE